MKFFPILISLATGLSTIIGYFFIYIKCKNINKLISIFLSFSVGVIFTLSILELVPEGIKMLNYVKLNTLIKFVCSIIFFLIGYYIVKILCKLDLTTSNELSRVGVISFIVLFIHNALEGITTYYTSSYDISIGIKMAIGIILHNIPEGIIIALPTYYGTKNKFKTFLLVSFSGMSEFCGALIGIEIIKGGDFIMSISFMMFVIVGFMISLIVNELLPQIIKHLYIKEDIISFMIGVLLIGTIMM